MGIQRIILNQFQKISNVCLLLLLLAETTNAQSITIDEVQRVSPSSQPFPVVESYMAVNPNDPNNLMASALSATSRHSVVYVSQDGGMNWQEARGPEDGVFPGGDPMLTFDGNGRAYFTTITPEISVWRSEDGGYTWKGSAKIEGSAYDRQWVAASQSSGEATPPLFAAAKTQNDEFMTSVSWDGGLTFESPEAIPIDSGFFHNAFGLMVQKDGTVLLPYKVFYGYQSREEGILNGERFLLISSDSGKTWSDPYSMSKILEFGNAGDQPLMLKGLNAPGIAADESESKYKGSVYTTWPTIINNRLQIVAVYSRDGGRTWSDPVRVNDGGFTSNHSTPMIAVNNEGIVVVTWNDRRNDPEDACFQHYLAVSFDGGQSFSTNKLVSENRTCPGRGRWLNGGETQGLIALSDGSFRVTWSVGNRESLNLWTAVVRVEY